MLSLVRFCMLDSRLSCFELFRVNLQKSLGGRWGGGGGVDEYYGLASHSKRSRKINIPS